MEDDAAQTGLTEDDLQAAETSLAADYHAKHADLVADLGALDKKLLVKLESTLEDLELGLPKAHLRQLICQSCICHVAIL